MKQIKQLAPIFLVICMIIGALALWNGFTTVGVGKEKAKAFMGKVDPVPLSSGWHLCNPFANFYEYDLQDTTYEFEDVGVPAQDKLKTVMDIAVTGHFLPGSSVIVRENTGRASTFMTAHYNKRVIDAILEAGKKLAEDSQAFFTPGTTESMAQYVIDRVNKELYPQYALTAVKFSDMRLPTVVNDAIIATKKRTEQVNQQQQALLIADLKAQEITKEAEARNAAATEDAAAIIKMANAEAEANIVVGKSVTEKLVDYTLAKRWNGVRSTHVLGPDVMQVVQ